VTAGNASSIRSLLSISPHLRVFLYTLYILPTPALFDSHVNPIGKYQNKGPSLCHCVIKKIIKEMVNTKTFFDVKNPPNVNIKNHKIL